MNSVGSSSSISDRKSFASVNQENRSKSCETNCTSNSTCFFKKRKPMNPLAYSMRPVYHKTNNAVKQRVMSAKLLKMRQLQSQLNDANYHLAEVSRENQVLKTLQKRQDKALSNYESTNADLPRLIHSHDEDVRVLTDRNKSLKKAVRELTDQLKQRDEELCKAKDQLVYLQRLSKNRNLEEREKLMTRLEEYKIKLQKSEEQVATLNRRLMLESKTSKQRLNAEIVKHKHCQQELLHAFDEIDRLSALLDAKENTVRPRNSSRFNRLQSRNIGTTLALKVSQTTARNKSSERPVSQNPVTEVKLEPLNGNDPNKVSRIRDNGFKAPIDNIRQRLSIATSNQNSSINLSSGIESRETSASGSFKSRPSSSIIKLEKLSVPTINHQKSKVQVEETGQAESLEDDFDLKDYHADKELVVKYDQENNLHRSRYQNQVDVNIDTAEDIQSTQNERKSKECSEEDFYEKVNRIKRDKRREDYELNRVQRKLKKDEEETTASECVRSKKDIELLAEKLDEVIQNAVQNSKEAFDTDLSGYCADVLNSVKTCSKAIEYQKQSLKDSKHDTEILIDTYNKTKKNDTKLQRMKNSYLAMDGNNMDLCNEVLNEEQNFQTEYALSRDKNCNQETKSLANVNNKRKLLATLRAIDNGDSVESVEEPKQGNMIKEIFGKVAH